MLPLKAFAATACLLGATLAFGDGVLAQGSLPAATPAAPQTGAAELEFWSSVKDSKNAAELRAYLAAYPNGAFAPLAKVRLQTLEAAAAAPKATPAPSPQSGSPSAAATTAPSVAAGAGASALSSPEVIREAQNKLYNLNYTIPNQSARVDAETRTAIRRWQSNTKRPETGDLTAVELAMLRAAVVPTVWGAVAYNVAGGASSHWNIASRARAEELAMGGCKNLNGGTCQVVTAVNRGCLVIAYASGVLGSTRHNNAFGIVRPTLAEATDAALTECRAKARVPNACGIRTTACADGSHKK
jgi:peptidoglycan hydrolase-like protein with peptidoglycan-binding domain